MVSPGQFMKAGTAIILWLRWCVAYGADRGLRRHRGLLHHRKRYGSRRTATARQSAFGGPRRSIPSMG